MGKGQPIGTLQQAILFFADYENCKQFMVAMRWPDGVVRCPQCGSQQVTYLEKARVWKCYGKHDRPKFSLKTRTIFEDSPIGLEKWLPVVWMLANAKNGISSWEVHRAMGVTQKTAWFMLQRARLALQGDNGGKLDGEIEVDETFIGGKARNMHKSRRAKVITCPGTKDKVVVAGILQRGGVARVAVVPNRSKESLLPRIRENVHIGADVFSDVLMAYTGLNDRYAHQVIDHATEYVRENVHTNGMENFWSLLKRALKGTYVSVEPFHLFRYLDEQAFRFNYRKGDDMERFAIAMKRVVGRRLTYKELTGKTESEESRPSTDASEVPF